MAKNNPQKDILLTRTIKNIFVSFAWYDDIRKHILTINKPIIPVCEECNKRIMGKIYYCGQEKSLYCKKCIFKKETRHDKKKYYDKQGQHYDYEVLLEVKE